MMSESDLNRREFAKALGIGAVTATLIEGAHVVAEAQEQGDKPKRPTVVDLQLEEIQKQYPHERLTDAALAQIRGDLQSQIDRSRRLSAFPLTNGDEPGFVFGAYRGA